MNVNEYNSFKHGFRFALGGFELAFGKEENPGVQAPPEKMHSIGRNELGTSFLVAEKIEGAPNEKPDCHFTTNKYSLNWDPENMSYGLLLISMSINNVLSYLKIFNGTSPSVCLFERPQNLDDFYRPWKNAVGVRECSINPIINEYEIKRYTKQEILENLKKWSAD